ncbi:MAG: hypothetical protein R2912_05920 [Eubacteriales bacterium]
METRTRLSRRRGDDRRAGANGVDVTAYLPVSGKRVLWHEFQKDLKSPEGLEAMERLEGFWGRN